MRIKTIDQTNSAFAYQLLIKDLLENSLRVNPDNQIIYKNQVSMNYYTFYDKVKKLCNFFKSIGLQGGQIVGVIDYDSHRYLMNYFAVPITGNVLHTINWRLAPAQILYTINHAEDEVLIIHEDFLPVIEPLLDQMHTVKKLIVIKEQGSLSSRSSLYESDFDALVDQQSSTFEFESFSEQAIATLFYTTGTTGNPKAVYFTHRQLVLHTMVEMGVLCSMNQAFKITIQDVYMPLTPMFHVHAWGMPYLATALSLKQVYVGKFEPDSFFELFTKQKPTVSHCVPTILNMILNSSKAKAVDLSNWKLLIGGSALSKPLALAALKRGISIVSGYGMSETCPLLTTSYLSKEDLEKPEDQQAEMRCLTGRAAFLVDIKVIDQNGNQVKQDSKTLGEVVVRAPYLTMGYYKDDKGSEELWRNGYLHTGDIAWMNQKGDIKIVDRFKDVIKTGGEWMSSLALEELIASHSNIAEVAVIGIEDKKWGERPLALVVEKNKGQLTSEMLKEFMHSFVQSNLINKWAIPDRFVFIDQIPKTSVGKISKKEIRELYG
ncbi:fatty acid--CoA ligase [Myroides sp. LJL119]